MLRNLPAQRSNNIELELHLAFNVVWERAQYNDFMPRMPPRAAQGVIWGTPDASQCRPDVDAHCEYLRLNSNASA